MKKLVATAFFLCVLLAPIFARAGIPTYSGNLTVPSGAKLTLSGLTQNYCLLGGTAGVVVYAACPTGTAAFVAGTNITITGSGPYTISAPNVLALTGGTVTGATTFSAVTTFSQAPVFSLGATNNSTTIPITSGTTGNYSAGFQMGTTGGLTALSTTASSIGTCSIPGNALAIVGTSSTLLDTFDQNGNLCSAGTQYYVSARKEKQNIHDAHIDALAIFRHVNFNQAWQYKTGIGDPKQVHYGAMADDLPEQISGPNHGRIDLQALVNYQSIAIGQLDRQQMLLWVACGLLCAWCLGLTVLVFLRD